MARRITVMATRRRILLAVGAVAGADVAMPQASRAQSAVWRMQSAWSSKDIFHEFAVGYAKTVGELTGGRLQIDMVAAGSVVPPLQMQDAVHAGILDGSHGICDVWQRKHKAAALFSSPPPFGWDSDSMLAWFYQGGGEALYRELINDVLKLNLVGLLCFPMPVQPLGWFKKDVKAAGDLHGISYRTDGLAIDLFKELGASVTVLPGGDVVQIMDRGLLDAAGSTNPSSDLQMGFPDVAKFYVQGGFQRSACAFEIAFNKAKHDALPTEIRSILRHAALAVSTSQRGIAYARGAKDLDAIRRRGVKLSRTSEAILQAQLAAWDKVIAEHSKDKFFAKVVASQKAWAKLIEPYRGMTDLATGERVAAYRHFFG
jgi:TRAP-type mannitol/chloroaromatic compound transport system substrate-binding protein